MNGFVNWARWALWSCGLGGLAFTMVSISTSTRGSSLEIGLHGCSLKTGTTHEVAQKNSILLDSSTSVRFLLRSIMVDDKLEQYKQDKVPMLRIESFKQITSSSWLWSRTDDTSHFGNATPQLIACRATQSNASQIYKSNWPFHDHITN